MVVSRHSCEFYSSMVHSCAQHLAYLIDLRVRHCYLDGHVRISNAMAMVLLNLNAL